MIAGIIGGSGFYGKDSAIFDSKPDETEDYIVREIAKSDSEKYTFLGKIALGARGLFYTKDFIRQKNRALIPLVQQGAIGGQKTFFISRHGKGHFRLANDVAYSAEIAFMKEKGVEAIITTAAVGGLNPDYSIGDFVVLDDCGELFPARENFLKPRHFGINPPYSERIRQALLSAGKALGVRIHDKGAYAQKPGPEFETAKEIDDLRRLGYDVVGMTTATEAKIARDAGIPLATICLVTNAAQGKGSSTVSDEEVQEIMAKKRAEFSKLLRLAVLKLREDIELARERLSEGGLKISAAREGKIVFESQKGGIMGLLEALESGADLKGASFADTVVGGAAATILAKLGAKEVHAKTLSERGKKSLEEKGIKITFGELVESILNRARDGKCPFEKISEEEPDNEKAIARMKDLAKTFLDSAPVKSNPSS